MTLTWLVWDCSIDKSSSGTAGIDVWAEPVSYVYTVVGSYLCLFCCWSVNVKIFESVGIDYAHLLDWNPKHCKCGDRLIAESALYASLYCSNMIMYLKLRQSNAGSLLEKILPSALLPIALLVGMCFIALLPLRRRAGIWDGVANVMKTPFGKIRFREVVVGDFLTSLPKPNTGTFSETESNHQKILSSRDSYRLVSAQLFRRISSIYDETHGLLSPYLLRGTCRSNPSADTFFSEI